MKVLVVDDEDLAREALVSLLDQLDNIEILDVCDNGIDAVRKIKSLNPDVVFLDIKMPQIDGFEVLELLGDDAPAIIFVTAYDEFAVRAFEINAVDYLLKPVDLERLRQSILKIREIEDLKLSYKSIVQQKQQTIKKLDRILVRDRHNVHIININEILWLEAQDDYVAIKTINNLFLKLDTLSRLEKKLDPGKFKRIHRSYIVNMNYVQRIEDQKWAVLKNSKKLPVSKSGYSRLF